MLKKPAYILYFLYLIFFGITIFYIRDVVSDDSISVVEKDNTKKDAIEIKPVKVTLRVELPRGPIEYAYKLENIDSVYDLVETAWKEDKLYYEKTYYLSGLVIDNIGRVKAPNGSSWKLFHEDEDLTQTGDDVKLRDKKVYVLKLVSSSE